MDLGSLMVLYSILFGLAFGSFLNVCIYRIPLKKSIIRPPSSCPHCGVRIKYYDNIPLVSYLFLLGKCRYCHSPLSWQYPVVEAMTGAISMVLFIKYGLNYQYFIFFLFLTSLLVVSFIDFHHKIIPDILSLPGIVVGLMTSLIIGHISWMDSLIGIIAGGGGLFLVAVTYKTLTGKEGMGMGDVKLLAMIGAWMGWRALPLIILISSLTGAIIGSAMLLVGGKGIRARIPFGPFLSLAALLYFFFGQKLATWYYNLFI